MNYELSLSLELLEKAAWGFQFRLTIQNRSTVKLSLPSPEIIGIRFSNKVTMNEAEWYTGLLVSARSSVFRLQPKELRYFAWRVRPCDIERPDSHDDFDYYRWCVELPAGNYSVWYQWRVDADFFAPDSHMKLPDLDYLAEREGAAVWQGQAVSNRIQLDRA